MSPALARLSLQHWRPELFAASRRRKPRFARPTVWSRPIQTLPVSTRIYTAFTAISILLLESRTLPRHQLGGCCPHCVKLLPRHGGMHEIEEPARRGAGSQPRARSSDLGKPDAPPASVGRVLPTLRQIAAAARGNA